MLGHSFGANGALEMGAGGHFDGALILLAPSFSREDEVKALGIINRIGYVPGVRSGVEPVLSRSYRKMLDGHVPEERLDALAAEVATSRWPEMRMIVRRYFEYLDRHGTLAGRLCRSGVSAEGRVRRGGRRRIDRGRARPDKAGVGARSIHALGGRPPRAWPAVQRARSLLHECRRRLDVTPA